MVEDVPWHYDKILIRHMVIKVTISMRRSQFTLGIHVDVAHLDAEAWQAVALAAAIEPFVWNELQDMRPDTL